MFVQGTQQFDCFNEDLVSETGVLCVAEVSVSLLHRLCNVFKVKMTITLSLSFDNCWPSKVDQ